jgi:hypothetical protein
MAWPAPKPLTDARQQIRQILARWYCVRPRRALGSGLLPPIEFRLGNAMEG